MQFYVRLDEILNERKISRRKLCENAQIPYNTLNSMIKRQSQTISLEIVCKIADYLDISSDYLLGLSDIASRPEKLNIIPSFRSLADAIFENISALYDKLGDDAAGYDDLFTKYISSAANTAIDYCKDIYAKKDYFANDNGEIDLGLMELFMHGRYHPEHSSLTSYSDDLERSATDGTSTE